MWLEITVWDICMTTENHSCVLMRLIVQLCRSLWSWHQQAIDDVLVSSCQHGGAGGGGEHGDGVVG